MTNGDKSFVPNSDNIFFSSRKQYLLYSKTLE